MEMLKIQGLQPNFVNRYLSISKCMLWQWNTQAMAFTEQKSPLKLKFLLMLSDFTTLSQLSTVLTNQISFYLEDLLGQDLQLMLHQYEILQF